MRHPADQREAVRSHVLDDEPYPALAARLGIAEAGGPQAREPRPVAAAAPAAPARRRARRGRRVALLAVLATVLPVTALAVAGTVRVPGLSPAPAADTPLRVLGADRTATLGAYRGRVLVVTFSASWCQPCIAQVRLVERAAARLHAAGAGTAVLVGWHERDADARRWLAAHGLHVPVLVDPRGAVARAYRVRAIPDTFVLDARGRIASVVRGRQTARTLAAAIARARRAGAG